MRLQKEVGKWPEEPVVTRLRQRPRQRQRPRERSVWGLRQELPPLGEDAPAPGPGPGPAKPPLSLHASSLFIRRLGFLFLRREVKAVSSAQFPPSFGCRASSKNVLGEDAWEEML